jgi:hypothetical protein
MARKLRVCSFFHSLFLPSFRPGLYNAGVKLLCRIFGFRWPLDSIALSRLAVGDTAGWQPALRKYLEIAVAFGLFFASLLGLSGMAGRGKRSQIPALV